MFSSFFKPSSSTGGSSGSFSANWEVKDRATGEREPPWGGLFTLYEGTSKQSGAKVTVFVADGQNIDLAKAALKRLKTLRHPSVLTFLDSSETESKVQIVTEHVSSLQPHLEQLDRDGIRGAPRDHYMAWGLFQVLRGISFLNTDAKLRHNALYGDSIFINDAGDWKLFGLHQVSPADEDPNNMCPSKIHECVKYDPPELTDSSKRRFSTSWSRDMWGLGCLIWEVFNGPLPAGKNLGQLGQIPKKVGQLYMELVAANPKKRPNPKERLETMRRSGGYFKNELIDVLTFLEELQIKEESDKGRFYSALGGLLEGFPPHVCTHKILPELIKAFEFGNAGAAILGPMFKLGKNLDSEEYVRTIVPCVIKLFASNDRNARFKLLQQVESFVEHLSNKVVNDEVFGHIQSGFLDQEPIIREKTVIAMIHLAPKLNFSNLDECVVMKHFARLLRDEQAGIRTNTAVCLGKIAKYLHYSTRQKVLIPAFTGKLRDPFPPARIAAINALAATQQFYTLQETSTRVLPALCPALGDPEPPVRQQAFKVSRGFVDKLEQVSKDPSLKEEMEAEVMSTNSSSNLSKATGWASWAVGAIGAKFYKSSTPPPQPAASSTPSETSNEKAKPEEKRTQNRTANLDNDARSDISTTRSTDFSASSEQGSEDVAQEGNGWGDEEEDWGSLEDSFKQTNIADKSELSWSPSEPKARPASKKAAASSGWDDPSEDWGEPIEAPVDKDEEKRLRDEKRAARKAELAAKREARKAGPLKLGAKKKEDDFEFQDF